MLIAAAAGCSDAADRATAPDGVAPDATDSDAASGDAASAGADPRSIYVDRTVQVFGTDRNRRLEGYQEALATCQASGAATAPLSASDQAKVGTERWQIWRDGSRAAWRQESWAIDNGPAGSSAMCQFKLESQGQHGYIDRARALVKDLATGEVTESDGDPSLFDAVADDPTAGDDVNRGAETQPSERTIAGQPCVEWRGADGASTCTWTGDGHAPAPGAPFSSLDGISLETIVLAAAPGPGKTGDGLETTIFRIGGGLEQPPLDPRTYEDSP